MSSLPPPPTSSLPPPPPPPADPRRWGLGDVVVSIGLFVGVSIVVGVVAFAASDGSTDAEDILEGPWLPIAVCVPPLVQLSHALWVARTKGTGVGRDFAVRFRPRDLAVGAGLGFAGLVGATVVGALVYSLLDTEPSANVAELAEDSAGDGGLTVWVVLLAVAAATLVPVVEELVYRGMLWSALEKRGTEQWPILVLTSLVFALVHFEPLRFPVLFVLGLALGYGRIRTGRIGPCIAAHALINGLGMVFLLVEIS